MHTRTTRPAGYWATAFTLLGFLLLDGALVLAGAFDDGRWHTSARVFLAVDVLAFGYWLLLHPFVHRWLHRSPY